MHSLFQIHSKLGKKHIPYGPSTWLTVPKRYVNTGLFLANTWFLCHLLLPWCSFGKLSFISGYPFQGSNSLDWFILSAEATIGLVGQGPLFEAWWFDASIEVILRVSSGKR